MSAVEELVEADWSLAHLEHLYREMLRIRFFELAAADLYRDGLIPGFVHLSVGQEGCAVGVCSQLRLTDVITSTHRGHGHVLAKGADMKSMFAELFGRETGSCAGRGGSMHIADPTRGILGANGIVAGGLPMAVGAGLAAQLKMTDAAVVAFFGDGAVAQGAFHEAVNLASSMGLPVLFACENNGYSEFTKTADSGPSLADRAAGYGLEHHLADGSDVVGVAEVARNLVERVRNGAGPVFLELITLRGRGHYEGDPQRYRSDDDSHREVADPIAAMETRLSAVGLDETDLEGLRNTVCTEVDAARDAALADPAPDPAFLLDHVHGNRIGRVVQPGPAVNEKTRYSQSIRAALDDALAADPSVFLAGIDIGAGGGVFGITKGLADRYPGRVLDTPISETAIIGAAVGAAAAGLKPVVELMYFDFVGVAFDQLLNQAAKLRFMTGGKVTLPLTVRTQFGAGRSSGSQHSQSLESLLAHVPGLMVVMPSDVGDAYRLLRASIAADTPVVFIENRLLYERRTNFVMDDVALPLGRARRLRAGDDVTIVSMSRMVHDCLAATEQLATRGVSCDVIDLRTVVPLDIDTIVESVNRTSRLLVVHEAVRDFGVGAEIVAQVTDRAFFRLDAAPVRLGGPRSPVPYAPNLEQAWLPDVEDIVATVEALVAS